MTVQNLNFAAEVSAWVRETEARMTAVFRQSAQEVIEEMQTPVGEGGRMPVDTGFLRSSLQVSLNADPVPATRENPGGIHGAPDAASLVIGGAELGDRIVASYSANYARHVEYGARGRPPRGFVRGAAQQWQSIVRRVAQRLKDRVAAGR
ncbi:hypothetical protein RHODGE_RHODGE_01025 [Rhodoplanes serenus]|uniref:HK97 gp10 family phage protein n=1 Tax=Rhodoplanes serenus TaxID=200615 RepID=A0A3S4DC24_9BRAD|nr:HK97 gp10 family phage protein [Rhodoplanes serenus]VCU06583.1 hypothetical protein RHODPL_RHODPL_00031 [Rhodoplanes serenus]VCU07875.1 hypothetical protein RHODGE_RHODGE_01025 [Rhodoplanes serenus]